ncbi:MAG: amidohydrolase family protein, partial [Oscillospiraceae bacterium]
SDYAKQVNPNGCSHNYGLLVGHGALRGCVMGFDDRDPTPAELEELKAVLDRELSRGAFGMSLGLIYPPSAFCKLEELVALAEVVKQHNAILTVHMRNEGPRLFEAVDEMIEVTERSGVHLQISHLKLMGKPQWGRADELLQKIENARARGLDITCDQYPYNATSTGLAALTPKWAQDGGIDRLLERLGSHDRRLLDAILLEMGNRGGPACVLVSSTHGHMPEAEGKRIDQISDLLHLSPEETVAEILIRSQGGVEAIYFSLDEKDIIEILRDMRIAIGSDGTSFCYDPHVTTTAPHPRSFGTFPRFLRMNRELRLMPIQDAVYKLTGLPASILGLPNRGVLRAGAAADITVFDEKTVTDCSDFLHPVVKPQGIECVLVAGEPTVLHNRSTEAHAG